MGNTLFLNRHCAYTAMLKGLEKMFVSDNIGINDNGNMTIAGHDCANLAAEYHTPLYIMDEDVLRANMRAFKNSIEDCYGSNGLVCFASKAFCCREICRIAAEEGIGLDISSGGELYTALSAGFDPAKLCLHGNNKSSDELRYAVSAEVGRIVVDNIDELYRLDKIAQEAGKRPGILFRIKPGIDAHTHDFIRTGQIDSKFGFALETGEAFNALREALSCNNLNIRGVHCHIGSQIFDIEPFTEAARVMLGFIAEVKSKLSYEIPELNLGGGFGIRYTQKDNPPCYSDYIRRVSKVIDEECARLSLSRPFILIEPGRSIAGSAGTTLYTVGAVKEIPGIRTYVSVDGGMCDNPRYALYQSEYSADIVSKADQSKTTSVTLAGKCCESGDLLGENIPLQPAESGDILAVHATGAYNYSMSSNYNRTPRPAVVFVGKDLPPRIAVKREDYADLIRNDI